MNARVRPVVLITGAGRSRGIGAAIARRLAGQGWDVGFTYWAGPEVEAYGSDMGRDPVDTVNELESLGARTVAIEADFADTSAPVNVFDSLERQLGAARALVLNHTLCVERPLLATTADLFDRHLAVNVRGALLLIQEFASRYRPELGPGRIISLTSDHTAGNVPYGVSKGAADRLIDAAAHELAALGITANAINPGPVDTGWITDEDRANALTRTPLGRGGRPEDAANLAAFLCSEEGGWVTGQLLYSNGGFRGTIS
jgi:3-oxoacyl-[acyl-carrier protein] reductase